MIRQLGFLSYVAVSLAFVVQLGAFPDVAPRGAASVGSGKVSPDGKTEVACDLPDNLQRHNINGTDGKGQCVWASIMHAARWQHVACLEDLLDWMKKRTGGGWPARVSQLLPVKAKEAGVQCPPFIQVESDDIEVLKLACRCGRMPGVTYNYSPTPGRYSGRIPHMVSLVHADDRWFVVLDNNFPGSDKLQWMDPSTAKGVFTGGAGQKFWAVVLLDPPPPPPPFN